MLEQGRACAFVCRDETVLMVRHTHDGRDYWTLPGGRVEPGESAADAALRELHEETGLRGRVGAQLYQRRYRNTAGVQVTETCFGVDVGTTATPQLGFDPELAGATPILAGVAWRPLSALGDDPQVRLIRRSAEPR